MTTTDLTLDERAAKVLGWELQECPANYGVHMNIPYDNRCSGDVCWKGNGFSHRVPAFSRSIDAQRPLEEMARAQGWTLDDVYESRRGVFFAQWHHPRKPLVFAEAPTEPEARLACLLKVLEETK